jgi:adenylate cyclase
MYKGKHIDLPKVARELKVSHVLEGSVRKAGGRVRITAQLIDGASNDHVWAERYDRELSDIFALQDEISQAVVKALKLKLLPEEKKAIEQRGTNSAEAYKFYLMARQYGITGNYGDARHGEAIIRLCRRATELDPNYARAWALMATTQRHMRFVGWDGGDGLAAAERAIALDNSLAEAHAAKGEVFMQHARLDEAQVEIELALKLDPECYEANNAAARWHFSKRKIKEAIAYWSKASTLVEVDYGATGMMVNCCLAIGDMEGARRAAALTIARTERIVALYPENGSAMGHAITALAVLGEAERVRELSERSLLFDPDNKNMRYNLACVHILYLHEYDAALDLLEPLYQTMSAEPINWSKVDPDLDAIREHPRYKAMLAAAEARLAGTS